MAASDPESVLTNADIESAYWVIYPDQAADPITFACRVERLVRERLAERIEAANRKPMSDFGLSLIEALAIIRGER